MIFLKQASRPTKLKKILYISSSIILGLLISFNLHALVEINYINWAAKQGKILVFYSGCALPFFIQINIWLIGIISGYFFGIFFWRKIYVKRLLKK